MNSLFDASTGPIDFGCTAPCFTINQLIHLLFNDVPPVFITWVFDVIGHYIMQACLIWIFLRAVDPLSQVATFELRGRDADSDPRRAGV